MAYQDCSEFPAEVCEDLGRSILDALLPFVVERVRAKQNIAPLPADLTPREFAKRIGVKEATVTSWCRRGLIKCKKVGIRSKGEWRIEADQVEKILSWGTNRRRVLLYKGKNKI